MMIFLNTIISNKLIDAKFITLITDIWTNLSMSDFLALGSNLFRLFKQIDDSYYKESFDESDINDESNKEKVIEINDSEDFDAYEEEREEEIMVYDQFVENSTNFLINLSNNKEKEEIEENDTNPTTFFTEELQL